VLPWSILSFSFISFPSPSVLPFLLSYECSDANKPGEATEYPGKSFLFFLMANCPNQKILVVLSGAAGISGGWTVEPDYLAKRPYCQN
jgi:hypothetical protein